jgi:hypothetical protein
MKFLSDIGDDEFVDENVAAFALGGLPVSTLRSWRFRGIGPEYFCIGRLRKYTGRTLRAVPESC